MSLNIAMWSGPRNISTAMMRAWENRSDTIVIDEPLYAHYLKETGYIHPMKDAIIAWQENDWRKVVNDLITPRPDKLFYQKHMTHHMLPSIELAWLNQLTNCFLIRDPRAVLLSFSKIIEKPQIDQLGIIQQQKLFQFVCQNNGRIPPVIDSQDILQHPENILHQLCNTLGIPFETNMLSWPAGKRATDGIWAEHWYKSVAASTEFATYKQPSTIKLPPHLQLIVDQLQPIYEEMYQYRIKPTRL